jgi:FixJ family two-component response regulator
MQSLSRIGFAPQVWGSMRHTLDKLLHQRFAAVIVDRKFTNADVLEFILNVRDINQKIPVIVIGSGNDERIDRKISKLGQTIILNGSERDDKLGDKLIQALKCSEKEDV